ncbi:ABC transporter permease [Agathobaculum sp. TL06]
MKKQIINAAFKYSQVVMLLLIILVFSITTPNFFTLNNFATVVMKQLPFLLIISLGMTLAILANGIDLSIGSTLALSSCVASYFLVKGQDTLGILSAVVISCVIGYINGILITKIHLVPFIATYSMNLVARGLAYLFMGGMMYYGFSDAFCSIAGGSILGISNLLWIAAVIFLLMFAVMKKTVFGRNIYGVGSNKEATTLSGINSDRVLIAVYTINGLLAGITGLLYISRLNAAESTIGADFTLQMIAATLIGGTRFGGGKGGVGRTLVGVLTMMFLTNAMNLNKVSSLWQDAVFGAVIILSLFIDLLGEKVTTGKKPQAT